MRARALTLAAGLAATTTVGGMIATPLLPHGGRGRAALSSVVIGGLSTFTAVRVASRWRPAAAAGALGVTALATLAVERIGTATGRPFGRYHYTRALRPQVGGVPAIVPLAWFAMAMPARETAHAVLGAHSRPWSRALLGAGALTAWDLFLDPQMVGEGYWVWGRRGRYRGIPMQNFAGWFATAVLVMAVLELSVPPRRDADPALVGAYAFMGTMETVAFARFFRDPVVAVVGGLGMLPIAARAVTVVARSGRDR